MTPTRWEDNAIQAETLVRLVGPRWSWQRAHFWLGVAATIYIVLLGVKPGIALHFPNSIVIGLWDWRLTEVAVEIWLDGSNGTLRRLIHPTADGDLSDARPVALRLLAFSRRAHIAALVGSPGQIINAAGALMLIALSIGGLAAREHSSATSGRKKSALTFYRIVGTIGSFFAILWGVTGACLVFPTTCRGSRSSK